MERQLETMTGQTTVRETGEHLRTSQTTDKPLPQCVHLHIAKDDTVLL